MKRKFLDNNRLRHTLPFAAACFTASIVLFACADKDVETNENNGKALVAFNVSTVQDQAKAAAKAGLPMTRTAFANQLALQNLTPEDLTMQKLPVQGKAGAGLCLIETTLPGVPSQREATAQTRADITTMSTMQNFSTTAFYGSSDTSLEPWFYDKDTKKDGNLVTPIYWDWIKNHACFYAVYPKPYSKLQLSPSTYTGTPYVDFEVEPNVKNQKDLMTTCSGNVHLDAIGAAPRTDLTFRHALTAVRFKVGQNLSYSKHITKVEIVNALSKGKYVLPTDKNQPGAWDASTLSTPATFTLGGDGTVNVSTSEAINNVIMGNTGDNFVFYMIPQSLAGVQVKVYFDYAPTPAITANLAGTWKPGTTKTYALSQNTSTWQYELTVTPSLLVEYNKTAGYYTIQSYRRDPLSATLQSVPWEVVGYDTNNDGIFSMTEPQPNWFKGLSKVSSDGSTIGETVQATLQPEDGINDQLAYMNANLKLNPKGTPVDYYDLSTHDVKGNPTARNTANCYVISHPGYYKIPLVYGNAIKNGGYNVNAYTSFVAGSYVLDHFKDHNDQNITDPWITQSNWGANTPNGAKLVWADESGLVTNLAVTGSGSNAFVQFEVPAANIKNGNAVIAVTRNGVVVWSWHLWFIHDNALNTVTCTNFQGHEYKFTQETLGMKYNIWYGTTYTFPRSIKVKVIQKNGQGSPVTLKESIITITQLPQNSRNASTTLYQFGRKDALPGTNTIAEGYYAFDNTTGGHSLGHAIQHPENMLRSANFSSDDWCNVAYYNLWSANNTATGFNDNAVVKTIYDPCPAGFKLPASNAFTGFTKGRGNTQIGSYFNIYGLWGNGYVFKNKLTNPDDAVYFPAAGYRYSYTDALGYVGVYGYCWSAIPFDTRYGCHLYFSTGYVYPLIHGWQRAQAISVHPVADN